MRWLYVLLTVFSWSGCYAASPPSGAPCDPAAPRCPRGQVCVASTCQPEGSVVIDAPANADAVTAQRGCPADPDLTVCLSFDPPTFASPLANEGALSIGASFTNVTRIAVGTGGAAQFSATSQMQFPATDKIAGIVAMEATVRLDAAIAPMTRVGIIDTDVSASGISMFILAGTTTAHRISCTFGSDALLANTDLALGAWTTIACSCENATMVVRRDGVLLATGMVCTPGSAETFGVQIGQNSRGTQAPNDPLSGALDRVQLWKRLPQ